MLMTCDFVNEHGKLRTRDLLTIYYVQYQTRALVRIYYIDGIRQGEELCTPIPEKLYFNLLLCDLRRRVDQINH